MWMGTVNMNFFIISLARIEPHSFAPLRPACFGALPPSPARLRFVRRWRARRGPGAGPARPLALEVGRAQLPGRRGGRWATRNLANFLRPLAPGGRTIRLPGSPSDSCQRGRSFWEPPSEGETCGETGAKVVRGEPALAAAGEAARGGFEEGHTPRHPHSPVHIRPLARDRTAAPHHTHAHTRARAPFSAPWLAGAENARRPPGGTAPWHARASTEASLPSPATWPRPRGTGPAPCVPRQPLGFGIFFSFLFAFLTQLVRLNSPATGDSSRPGKVGKRPGPREFIDTRLVFTRQAPFPGKWFGERKVGWRAWGVNKRELTNSAESSADRLLPSTRFSDGRRQERGQRGAARGWDSVLEERTG